MSAMDSPPPDHSPKRPPREKIEKVKRIEREFGIPIPGEILPPEQWAKTAIKHLPAVGPLDWSEVFGADYASKQGVVLDLGCGNGRSTLWHAVVQPQFCYLGVDVLPVVIRYATRRANQRGLGQIRFAVIGGKELLEGYIADGSVAKICVYHPQPYYEERLIGKRLVTPECLAMAHRALVPGGELILQTDHPAYWSYMESVVPTFFTLKTLPGPWPDAPRGRTRREILATKRGLPVFRGVATRRDAIDSEAAFRAAASMPVPTFNADRRLLELDREEGAFKP
jgi:tRNA (guanine-N7-)-methyltransferase